MLNANQWADALILPSVFDWYLLIGDEAGLPLIARELWRLAPKCRLAVFAEVWSPASRTKFNTPAQPCVEWYYKKESCNNRSFVDGIAKLFIPSGKGCVLIVATDGLIHSAKKTLQKRQGVVLLDDHFGTLTVTEGCNFNSFSLLKI